MVRKEKTDSEPTFEQSFERLVEVVGKLEAGESTLTERTQLFEEGVRLSRACSEQLDAIEKRVEILLKSEQGSDVIEPFEEDEA